jgi:hypothetical protein
MFRRDPGPGWLGGAAVVLPSLASCEKAARHVEASAAPLSPSVALVRPAAGSPM